MEIRVENSDAIALEKTNSSGKICGYSGYKFLIAYISETVGPSSIRALICDHSNSRTARTTANPSNLSSGQSVGPKVVETKRNFRRIFCIIYFLYFLISVLLRDRGVKINDYIVKKS